MSNRTNLVLAAATATAAVVAAPEDPPEVAAVAASGGPAQLTLAMGELTETPGRGGGRGRRAPAG